MFSWADILYTHSMSANHFFLSLVLLSVTLVSACAREAPEPVKPNVYWACGGFEFAAVPDGEAFELYLPGQEPFRTDDQFAIEETDAGAVVVLRGQRLECVPKTWSGPWEEAKARGVGFRAVGQEPGWHAEVSDDRITLVLDYGERRVETPLPALQLLGGARGYHLQSGDTELMMLIEDLPCFDSMSGAIHPETVTLQLGDERFQGCGVTF